MIDKNMAGVMEILMNEGLQEEVQMEGAAVLESVQVETYENTAFLVSEVDEVRVDETAEIMADIFTEDVIADWTELSMETKSQLLNEYYIRAGENMGIDTKGVIVEPMESRPGYISYGYNSGDGYIHINANVLNDPSNLGEVLNTATHEMRHQLQSDAIENPAAFADISDEVLATWEYEWYHYISPDYDFQGYCEQAIEEDAVDFAENVLEEYKEELDLN